MMADRNLGSEMCPQEIRQRRFMVIHTNNGIVFYIAWAIENRDMGWAMNIIVMP